MGLKGHFLIKLKLSYSKTPNTTQWFFLFVFYLKNKYMIQFEKKKKSIFFIVGVKRWTFAINDFWDPRVCISVLV